MKYLAELNTEARTTHAYDVEVTGGYVYVYANNRDHAARIATRAGYVARSVNRVG